MSHHGSDDETRKNIGKRKVAKLREMFPGRQFGLRQMEGKLREMNDEKPSFPEGKFNENDQGQMSLAVAAQDGKVIVAFGKDVAWMGLTPDGARDLADTLRANADKAEGKKERES